MSDCPVCGVPARHVRAVRSFITYKAQRAELTDAEAKELEDTLPEGIEHACDNPDCRIQTFTENAMHSASDHYPVGRC